MQLAATIAVSVVALLHFAFFVLQAFLWTKPTGRKIFGRTVEQAQASAQLAVNQGIYNAFLACGLVWSLVHTGSGLDAPNGGFAVRVFFLGFIIFAGVIGAATAKRSILFVQAMPAAIAMLLVFAAR